MGKGKQTIFYGQPRYDLAGALTMTYRMRRTCQPLSHLNMLVNTGYDTVNHFCLLEV